MLEHIPEPAPSDRVTLSRKTRAWERESCCAVCGEPVALVTLHLARVLPFDDGDRVAHGACVAFRANHLHQQRPRPERDPIGDGMGA